MTTIDIPSEETAARPVSEPLGRLIRRAHKTANCLHRRIVESLGLTPVQADALSRLLAKEGLSLNELAERLKTDAPTLSGVVDCLVQSGFVERREDAQDRRRTRHYPTAKARHIEVALEQAEARQEESLTQHLSPEEVALLKTLLRRVSEAGCGG